MDQVAASPVEGTPSGLDAARGALGIHSPSRVFADVVGAQIPAGVGVGVREHAREADGAVAEIARPRAVGRGFGSVSISVQITVPGAASPAATAQAVYSGLEEELAAIFGRLAES